MQYYEEPFTDDERRQLQGFVTNTYGPAFALTGLPEVIKGAAFARYSRTHTSLRRLLLDEFLNPDEHVPIETPDTSRADTLYRRVFSDYGDDSVAQLGSAHVACEQVSNIMTKILERGRLMSYLEQSTRYINYAEPLGDRWRAYEPDLYGHVGDHYRDALNDLFVTYRDITTDVEAHLHATLVRPQGLSDAAWTRTVRAKALDVTRGLLPAATLSNVGVHGSGQAFEHLIMRLRAHPLPEARVWGELLLVELRQVIPSFLERLDRPDRGGDWVRYLDETRRRTHELVSDLFVPDPTMRGDSVELVTFDPNGERRIAAAIAYEHLDAGLIDLGAQTRIIDDRLPELFDVYTGDRRNRRHRPGRAFEATSYHFDIVCDYASFRDLQRHRLCTIDWQPLTTRHGYDTPVELENAGVADRYHAAMARAVQRYHDLSVALGPEQSTYLIPMGHRIRFRIELNAREAMHICELRTTPQGHPNYRWVCQQMHDRIKAVHPLVGRAMSYVDHSAGDSGRAEAERRNDRSGAA